MSLEAPHCSGVAGGPYPTLSPSTTSISSGFYNSSIHSSPCPFSLLLGKCRSNADHSMPVVEQQGGPAGRNRVPWGQGRLISNTETESMSADGKGEGPESEISGGSATRCSRAERGSCCERVSPREQALGQGGEKALGPAGERSAPPGHEAGQSSSDEEGLPGPRTGRWPDFPFR